MKLKDKRKNCRKKKKKGEKGENGIIVEKVENGSGQEKMSRGC